MSIDNNGQHDYVEPTTDLLSEIMSDAKELATGHSERIKLEIRQELEALKSVIRMTGVFIAAVVLGGVLLAQALGFGLAELTGWPLSASFAGVGLVLAIAGYAAYRSARSQSADLVPEESLAAAKNDVKRVGATVKRALQA